MLRLFRAQRPGPPPSARVRTISKSGMRARVGSLSAAAATRPLPPSRGDGQGSQLAGQVPRCLCLHWTTELQTVSCRSCLCLGVYWTSPGAKWDGLTHLPEVDSDSARNGLVT